MTSCRTCLVFGFRHPKSGPCHPSNTLSGSASNPIKDLDTYEGMRDEKKQVKKEQFEEFEQDGLRDVSVLFFNGQKDTGSRPPEARSRRALRERESERETKTPHGEIRSGISLSGDPTAKRRYDWILPNLYNSVEHITVPEKVRLDLQGLATCNIFWDEP